MIIWLVGLSGAGKTTIGRELFAQWQAVAPNTVLVDGDEIRAVFKHDSGPDAYNVAGRRKNAERIVELCLWLDRQNINVVCSILCIFDDVLTENRKRFPHYFEVFVDAPIAQVIARDVKGVYGPAVRGETKNVVGVDIPFPHPKQPDYHLDNGNPGLDAKGTARDILRRALESRA